MLYDEQYDDDMMDENEQSFYDFEKQNGYLNDSDEDDISRDTGKNGNKPVIAAVIITAVVLVAAVIISQILKFRKSGEKR